MKKFLKFVCLQVIFGIGNFTAIAQQKTLSYNEFLGVVRQFHPVVKQAGLQVDIANAELMAERGAFDPTLYVSENQKEFSSKNYYNYFSSELKIPTWYGLDFKAGTENNGGIYTSNELTTGQSSFVGFQAALGKGLLMDKRRAAVLLAKQMVSFSEAERQLAVNDLLYKATASFYEWQNAYLQKTLIDSVLNANQSRFSFVKSTFLLGDRPAIDTTEALTQLQSFEALQIEANRDLENARFELSNYLWIANQQSYLLPTDVLPEVVNFSPLFLLENYLEDIQQHPKIRQASIKMEGLGIEKRLKFQSLLPTVNIQYNVLTKGYTFINNPTLFQNNFKWGFTVGMPLLLREGRAEYQKATLKISQQDWQNRLLITTLQNDVRQYYTTAVQLTNQLKIQEKAVENYKKLYDGEFIRFTNGESSLFLLNSRELKLLEAQQKLVALRAKTAKGIVAVSYASGGLWR
jgi:outer membrane protein TolC